MINNRPHAHMRESTESISTSSTSLAFFARLRQLLPLLHRFSPCPARHLVPRSALLNYESTPSSSRQLSPSTLENQQHLMPSQSPPTQPPLIRMRHIGRCSALSGGRSALFEGCSVHRRGCSAFSKGRSALSVGCSARGGCSALSGGCSALLEGCSALLRGRSVLSRGCSALSGSCSALSEGCSGLLGGCSGLSEGHSALGGCSALSKGDSALWVGGSALLSGVCSAWLEGHSTLAVGRLFCVEKLFHVIRRSFWNLRPIAIDLLN